MSSTDPFVIDIDDPRRGDVRELLTQHLAFANEHSPPEDVHALDLEGLLDPAVTFFSLRANGELLGIGALRQLDGLHGEVKSMHTTAAARRRGVGQALLDHLLAVSIARGLVRVSLETGAMDAFAPARELYARSGFVQCEPFGDYRSGRNSTCMTRVLNKAASESAETMPPNRTS